MVTAKFMIAAEGVILDSDTKAVSIFSILEDVQAEGFPVFIQKISLFVVLERAEGDSANQEFKIKISLGDLDLGVSPVAVNFQDKMRSNTIIRMYGIVIPSPGVLAATVLDGDRVLCSYTINATLRQPLRIKADQVPPATS
jgi:hypothetical protein